MRPKKNVLLYCVDPTTAGIMAFAISHRLHAEVFVAHARREVRDGVAAGGPAYFYAAMVVRGVGEDEALRVCDDLHQAHVPTLFLRRAKGSIEERETTADVCLTSNASVFEWMDRLRLMMTRKRGPKKLLPRIWVQGQPEIAERAA
jgi:hypothetical protein